MKNIVFAFSLLVLVMFCSQRGFARIQMRPDGCPPYKSIIRLWPKHHEDEELSRQLIEAFRQYPKACDEVWMCTALPITLPLEKQWESALMVVRYNTPQRPREGKS